MIGTLAGRLRAQPAADLEAVHLREHQVEHDEVEVLLGEARERLAAVGRLHDLVAVALQGEGEQRLDGLLVVDEQDAGWAVGHADLARVGPRPSVLGDPRVRYVGAVLDHRVYRAAFLPALVALFVCAFSLSDRPRAATTRLAPTRSTPRAPSGADPPPRNSLRELAPRSRDARARARAGDAGLADRVARACAARDSRRRARRRDAVVGETVDGRRTSRTSSPSARACRAAASSSLAHRDAPPGRRAAELSGDGRAARARARLLGRPRRCARRSCSVSTSGGTGGVAGARGLGQRDAGGAGRCSDRARRPRRRRGRAGRSSCPWSNGRGSAPIGLRAHGRGGRAQGG